MKNDNHSDQSQVRYRSVLKRALVNALRSGTLIVGLVSLAACSLVPDGSDVLVATSVAETVVAQAPPPTAIPTEIPTLPPPPSATLPPTEVVEVSDTAEPTEAPGITMIPFTPSFPTLGPTTVSATCCNLRVRNQNRHVTYWIGTTLPYGGNFIEPLHYVEFYPGKETWMRIWWCRVQDRDKWTQADIDKFYKRWKNELMYYCQYRDVLVDEPMKEISVQ